MILSEHFTQKIKARLKKIAGIKIVSIFALCLVFIFGGFFLSFGEDVSLNEQDAQQSKKEESLYAFGYDIFRELPEPITEGPVDETYLLSPGDEIIITVWGQLNLEYPLAVSEDGYITIPDEGGRIFTNGVSLKELKRLVAERLSQIYSSYINLENPSQSTAFVDVKLAKVRKLLVYVVGEVKTQGAYTISSSVATLMNLLNNAGGVKETGSLREIKIRRADGKMDVVDLYDFLITGKIDTKKTRVRYGDYIIVPLKNKSVTIRGEVKRPGIYEVIGAEGIEDLTQFAGGLNANTYLKRSQVRRFEINTGEKFIDLDLESIFNDPQKNFPLLDGDEITIFPNIVVRRRMVEIRGDGIKRPGIYQIREGMTVKDLIEQAEGLKEDVYLERGDLVRTEEDLSKRLTVFSLKDLYKEEAQGQYVYTGNEEKNFTLKEMDQVSIYSSYMMRGEDKHVTLEGHVGEPGTYVLPENMTLYDLIFSRGGFQDEDFKKRTYLELAHVFRKASGELEERIITFNLGKLLDGDTEENMVLEDSDRIKIYSYETLETKPFITIEGLIKRPGTYELADNMTLADLILLGGGLRPEAYKVEAVIARMQPEGEIDQREIATFVVPVEADFAIIPDEDKMRLSPYDKIVIRNMPGWEPLPIISVEGQVKYPGGYSSEAGGERLSSIIRRAGGLKQDALPEGAVLHRRKDIIEMTSEGQQESERVAINLRKALNNPGGVNDLILKDGDRIFVPHNPGSVEVKGAVQNPSILQFREGKGWDYYIKLCGGYHKDADKKNTTLFLPNNTAKKKENFLIFSSSPEVCPGSIIDVPFKGDMGKIEIIEVRGAVKKPTLIQYRKGQKLDYYINLCGGYKENAEVKSIVVHFPDGRVLASNGASSFNPYILPGCAIEVPFQSEEEFRIGDVEVRGAVKNPLLIKYRKGEKIDYYIDFCGGYSPIADIGNMIIHFPDGSTVERKGDLLFDPEILPGCVIEVPFRK